MAECLQKNGFDLVVYGRNQDAIAETTTRGATQVATPKALAEAIDILMLCLMTFEVVESLAYGDDEILAGSTRAWLSSTTAHPFPPRRRKSALI